MPFRNEAAPAIALCQNQRFHSRRAATAGLIKQCTICGNCKEKDQTWFLITESSREDKLNIWKWNEPMAGSATVHSLCSPRHVRELIVHWMTTGCLHYPFADAYPALRSFRRKSASNTEVREDHTTAEYQLGEIQVDREAIVRTLCENALSLNVILDELMMTLEDVYTENSEADFDDALCVARREM